MRERVEPRRAPLAAHALAVHRGELVARGAEVAVLTLGLLAGRRRRVPQRDELGDPAVEVEADLIVHRTLHFASAERRAEDAANAGDARLASHASAPRSEARRILPTAST